jgi:hypothetical protein
MSHEHYFEVGLLINPTHEKIYYQRHLLLQPDKAGQLHLQKHILGSPEHD